MAMLAERKQKVKWCLNPRGNDWAKDENKFCQRMLEKMGWQPGMGLGAKGQGRTDIVRLQMKNDTKGLGNKEKYDEVWTRQQENFDSLLAQLNGADKNDEVLDTNNIPSLEDKSKMSRARVHYHKFTRGKDVSKYSSKDLNCIIGIGKKSTENSTSELVTESSISMYDYFRSKSKKSNDTTDADGTTALSSPFDNNEMQNVNREVDEAENVNDNSESIKKAKKKSKRKVSDCDGVEAENENITSDQQDVLNNELLEENNVPIKKRKKKKKFKEIEDLSYQEGESLEAIDGEVDLKPLEENINNEPLDSSMKKKKKKRHKNKENNIEDCEL